MSPRRIIAQQRPQRTTPLDAINDHSWRIVANARQTREHLAEVERLLAMRPLGDAGSLTRAIWAAEVLESTRAADALTLDSEQAGLTVLHLSEPEPRRVRRRAA
jgi:hypothetical protein